jgi:transcriptional regulator with XRE-family HTH domain
MTHGGWLDFVGACSLSSMGTRPNDDLVTFLAKRVRELRLAKGWTQEDLGEHAQLKPETISRVETAAVSPDLRTLERIVRALDVRFGDVLDAPADPDSLSAEERDVIMAWRELDEERRMLGLSVLRAMKPHR